MNIGIFRKTLVDSLPAMLVCFAGLVGFVVLLSWAMLNMGTELLNMISKFTWLQKIFEVSLGVSFEGEISLNMMFAIAFTHMIAFLLSWSVVVAIATRTTVGEFENGTADFLLTLPVSRSQVFLSTSLVWWIAAMLNSLALFIGVVVSVRVFDTGETVDPGHFIAPAVNFLALNLAIGGWSALFGCCFNRRGMAIGLAVGLISFSLTLNFVEPFIEAISQRPWIKSVGLLAYYRPVESVRLTQWPVAHIAVLSAIATITWVAAWVVYCRKDVPTA